jgi:glycosyltransferase involved in cell wall biosynthesis
VDDNLEKLSVVMPVYNERDYVFDIISRVQAVELDDLEMEIILVDDGSTDGTVERLKSLCDTNGSTVSFTADDGSTETIRTNNIQVVLLDHNRGKGAALREGFKKISGDIVVIQDADLEYQPEDYTALIKPISEDRADVVYGSRFLGGPQRALYFRHYVGNKVLTMMSNLLTDLNLTDMETCYKMFRASVLEDITLNENGFGFEPEFTAKIARAGYRIYEVPISYYGRTYEEGKKIDWTDGVQTLRCILQYNVFG